MVDYLSAGLDFVFVGPSLRVCRGPKGQSLFVIEGFYFDEAVVEGSS